MNVEEFLRGDTEENNSLQDETAEIEENFEQEDVGVELDVQKAVVESLAADKAEQDERILRLEKDKTELAAELDKVRKELSETKAALEEVRSELTKAVDALSLGEDTTLSNTVSLLDRNLELADRFAGETREHVLEAIKEKRDQAEKDGRIRCAQLLEAVMVANESTGELAKKREALEKFFNDNQNILSGTVITELDKCGISYKNGEEYLLTSEIIRRTY
jgi:hypothetical protein